MKYGTIDSSSRFALLLLSNMNCCLSLQSGVFTDDGQWGARDEFGKDMWVSRVAPEVNQILSIVIYKEPAASTILEYCRALLRIVRLYEAAIIGGLA